MLLKIVLLLISLCGYFLMWFAIFGKKKEIDNMFLGGSNSLFEFIYELSYKLSPTLIKRILMFLLGLFVGLIGTLGVFLS